MAGEADARVVVERGWGSRGEVWTPGEVEVVARISDQAMRDEIEALEASLQREGEDGMSKKRLLKGQIQWTDFRDFTVATAAGTCPTGWNGTNGTNAF